MARALELSEFGYFSILYAIHTFVFAIFNGAIFDGFLVLSSGRYNNNWLYRNLVYRLLALCLIALIIIFLVIYTLFNNITIWNILSLAYASIFIILAYFVRRALQIEGKAYLSARLSGLMFLIFSFLLWQCYLKDISSINIIFLVIGSANFASCIVFFRYIEIPLRSTHYKNLASKLKKHIHYSKWVLLTAIIIQGASQGYIWLIGFELSLSDIGVYRAILNVIVPISLLCTGMSLTCIPLLSAKYSSGDITGFNRIFRNIVFFSIGVACILYNIIWFYGDWLLKFLYADNFSSHTEMLNILALGAVLIVIFNPLNDYSKSVEQPSRVFNAYLGSAITTFTLGYYLIAKYTLLGAAWGFVFTNLIFGIVLFMYFCFDKKLLIYDYFKSKSSLW